MATSNDTLATTGTRLPTDRELIAPRPNPALGSLCKCGSPAAIVLQGSWFPDGQSRAYCVQCHAHGTWRIHAALKLQEAEDAKRLQSRREILRTTGAVLMTVATFWGLFWVSGSDQPTAAGEPSLWHWAGIAPLGALGWWLTSSFSMAQEDAK